MCTVSFVPNSRGFYLAMNRDEKKSRATALRPAMVDLAGRRVILPRERDGGTWIAANDSGVCLALINWHRVRREPLSLVITRGMVVEALAGKSSSGEIARGIQTLPLRKLRPFRLIAIVPAENRIMEWRWNLNRLSTRKHPWKLRHWFSSGLDEARAEAERMRVCVAMRNHSANKDLKWLRHLHRLHAPKRGPFSICMHRPDAATVSYTEIRATDKAVVMRYADGPPCLSKLTGSKKLLIA